MERINLESGDSPEVRITRVAGSLQIKGWSEDRIRIEVQHEDMLNYTFQDDGLELSAQGDCTLRIPESSELHVGSVGGNAFISDMESETHIESVSGSLSLKNMGSTTVDNVSGNLNVRSIEGDFTVEKVAGNATFRDVEGELAARQVQANLSLRDIEGDIVARSHGNADLRLEPEADVQVEAKGNLFCYVEDDAGIDVSLHSGGQSITLDTPNGRQVINKEDHKFNLGDGGIDMRLSAAGHIDFRAGGKVGDFGMDLDLDFVDEMAGLADEISDQVTSQVETQLEALNEQLTALGDRFRNSGNRRANAVQRRVELAQHKLERKLHGRGGRVVVSAVKPTEPVSAKERALILQMVQEKKISVADAEMLLNTLEGRKPAQTESKSEPETKPAESKEGGNA